MLKHIMTIILIMCLVSPVFAKNMTLVNLETGEEKIIWINDTDGDNIPENITVQIIKKLEIEGNKTVIVYDSNMVKAYNALIAELQRNITDLQKDLEDKNKLLGEYISYKKKNIELNENISKLKKEITTLKTEAKLIKQQNEQYKDIITDLVNKQSNETKEDYMIAYTEWKKDVSNFKIAIILSALVCVIIGFIILKFKKRYDYPL
ncbi:MAG TPA: hypothetical protein EYH22_03775 [Candidatus Nanopusillus sp.]|nr:hypothetical protein [Candidatus Nanopusillus sp.]